MQIAVVGAGPAGAWSAILLARRGHAVTLFDSHAPWEKPCGGGVTGKALSNTVILNSDLPRKYINQVTVYFGDQSSVNIEPQQPIAVLSRLDLGTYLLCEAERAGVSILKSRVDHIEPSDRGWRLSAGATSLQSDFLIGADGATSGVRRTLGTSLQSEDLSMTLGYFIPGEFPSQIKIFFVPSFEGYIWAFPRPRHISYGLITRPEPGWRAQAQTLLTNFVVADLGSGIIEHAAFYSAPVPCLGPKAWKNNRISGERWALVGDAAGLADPITGEGIYFAFKSAEILAETIDTPGEYAAKIWLDIGRELARASHMHRRFYRGHFLAGDFLKRMVQLSTRSRTLQSILGNLLTGNQSYLGLKKKLFFSIPSIGVDLIAKRH